MGFLSQLINLGGPIIIALMLACVALWALIIERYWFFYRDFAALSHALQQQCQANSHARPWVINSLKALCLSEAKSALEQHQSSIRLLIKLCPLLGLLGTVSGMVSVFDVIALTGNSDVKAMAAGIYRATLPTMAGLMLALSALYFSHQIRRKSQALAEQLTHQLRQIKEASP